MKKSKRERKFVNSMRGMSDIPWPARKYRYAPTFGAAAAPLVAAGDCKRQIGEANVRHGRLRRKKRVSIPCSGTIVVRRGSLGRRRVYCQDCKARKKQRQLERHIEQQIRRFGRGSHRDLAREERRAARMFRKLRGVVR